MRATVDVDVHICITQFSLMALGQGGLVAKSAHIVKTRPRL